MDQNKENVEILDFNNGDANSSNQPSNDNNQNVILDNSVVNPVELQGIAENNVQNGINTFNQTENILNESIKNNLGTDDQIQNFNNITSTLQEDKKQLDSGVAETEKWFRESQEKKENKPVFNASINPTINNITNSVNFEKPVDTEVEQEVKEENVDVVDNTDKNKKGIAFIVILFIILFAFVFALPYITR